MFRIATQLAVALVLLGALTACVEQEPGVEKFFGVWAIDVPLSVEEAAKSDHFAHLSRDAIAADIQKHAGQMKVELNKADFISHLGASHVAMPYELMAYDGDTATLRITVGGTPDEVKLTMIGKWHMNMKFASTPTYDHCIWQKIQ